jgi:transcriptional regulator with XRE-family HTH domain
MDDPGFANFPYFALFVTQHISRGRPGDTQKLQNLRFVLVFGAGLWFAPREIHASTSMPYQGPKYRKSITMSTLNSDARRIFTANFRMLLTAAEWTQVEAAEQLGISQGSVSDFCSGNRVASMKGIESIAYRLGLPAEAFTARPITLDQMHKLLSGRRMLKVSERRAMYRTVKPYDPWFRSLRERWKRSPQSRGQIRVAVRALFGNETGHVIDWLDGK